MAGGTAHLVEWPKVLSNSLPSRVFFPPSSSPWPANWLEPAMFEDISIHLRSDEGMEAFQWKWQDTRKTHKLLEHMTKCCKFSFFICDKSESWCEKILHISSIPPADLLHHPPPIKAPDHHTVRVETDTTKPVQLSSKRMTKIVKATNKQTNKINKWIMIKCIYRALNDNKMLYREI